MKIEMSLTQFFRQFPDDDAAEAYYIEVRWPDGIECPHCQSENVQERTTHKTMHHRCRTCRKFFSVRVGTIMEDSKLGYQTWLLASYLLQMAKKGISSIKLGESLGISQQSAWYLSHRLRECYEDTGELMTGTVEVDETYIGGSDKNRHFDKKRGRNSQMPVVGAKERETGRVVATTMPHVNHVAIYEWLHKYVSASATLYTDEAAVYVGVDVSEHQAVKHKRKQYVRGDVHTNGIEGFWSLLKRAYHGAHHWYSVKHMQRYVHEAVHRFNSRDIETLQQLRRLAVGGIGRKLTYRQLTAA